MSLQEQDRERVAEQWLDEAIGYLRDTGPRAGLETRILAGLRAYVVQRRRRWPLVVAASAAAVLLAGLLASWPPSKPEATPNVVQKTSPVPVTAPAPAVAIVNQPPKVSYTPVRGPREVAAASVSGSAVQSPAVEARQATFPAAAPLTDQGRLLQAYLRQTPQHELVLIAARQRSSSLEIEDLSIAPLQIKDLTPKAEAEKDQD